MGDLVAHVDQLSSEQQPAVGTQLRGELGDAHSDGHPTLEVESDVLHRLITRTWIRIRIHVCLGNTFGAGVAPVASDVEHSFDLDDTLSAHDVLLVSLGAACPDFLCDRSPYQQVLVLSRYKCALCATITIVDKEMYEQIIHAQIHNERAIYIAQKKGIDAIGYNATDVSVQNAPRVYIREKLARAKMMFDLLINKQPKFLGETIAIE